MMGIKHLYHTFLGDSQTISPKVCGPPDELFCDGYKTSVSSLSGRQSNYQPQGLWTTWWTLISSGGPKAIGDSPSCGPQHLGAVTKKGMK